MFILQMINALKLLQAHNIYQQKRKVRVKNCKIHPETRMFFFFMANLLQDFTKNKISSRKKSDISL